MSIESLEKNNLPDNEHKKDAEPEAKTPERRQEIEEGSLNELLIKNREMYNLSGFPDITENDILRYTNSNEKINEKFPELIQNGLMDENLSVRQRAAEMIQYAPEEKQLSLQEKLPELIQEGLANKNEYVRERAAEMIQHAPEEAREKLIQEGLADKDWYVRRRAAEIIQYAPEEAREKLWELAEQKQAQEKSSSDLQKLAEKTPLYENDDRFFRKKFAKSGSGITLLDVVPGEQEKTHREKVIVRHIDITPYLAWKKAFESYGYWRAKGFNYVPIEPIIRAQMHGASPKVDVSTRVLKGPSVATWIARGGSFKREINKQQELIRAGLEEMGIAHGHLNEGNFIVYFPRTENGKPDTSRPPRVYAIDFDQAESSQQSS